MTFFDIWDRFWADIDEESTSERQGVIWQKKNGNWKMLVGDPHAPGRVFSVAVTHNPWTGEALPTQREGSE